MDILGIGFPELMFILIIAMMVFGPRRLPEIAAKAGKTIANLRSMSSGLLAEWQREITVAARLEELELEKTRQELLEAKNEITSIGKNVKTETSDAVQSASTQTSAVAKTISRDIKTVAKQTTNDNTVQPVKAQPDESSELKAIAAQPIEETSPQEPQDSVPEAKPAETTSNSPNNTSPKISTSVPSPEAEKVVDEQ